MADNDTRSDAYPDEYARAWGLAQGTLTVRPTTIRTGNVLGVGGTTLYVVQTYRRIDRNEDGKIVKAHDTVFVEVHGATSQRFALPPLVAEAMGATKEQAESMYARCEQTELASPRSYWGIVQGATRVSQDSPYQDERYQLDRLAATVLSRGAKLVRV